MEFSRIYMVRDIVIDRMRSRYEKSQLPSTEERFAKL